jgi:hypothetical protein
MLFDSIIRKGQAKTRTFVESHSFRRVTAGELDDEGLRRLENDIVQGGGATIPGTAGYKKIRCATGQSGKRGGWRVVFADYPQFGITYLVMAFRKSVRSDLSSAERAALLSAKSRLDQEVELTHGPKRVL